MTITIRSYTKKDVQHMSCETKECQICGKTKIRDKYSKRKWRVGVCKICVVWQVNERNAHAKAKAAYLRKKKESKPKSVK